MGGSRKKVIVRPFAGPALVGYLPGSGIVSREPSRLEVLDTAGRIVPVELGGVRYVAYVREFNLGDREEPEKLARRTFLARPRTEGLWVRLTFRDGEVLEGLAPLDVALLDDAMEDEGLYLIPPDVRSNTQRLYVPRVALSQVQLVGVVTTPSKVVARPEKERDAGPLLPFPEPRG